MRRSSLYGPAALAATAAVIAALGTTIPATASAAPVRAAVAHPMPATTRAVTMHRAALPAGERYVCPAPTKRFENACMSIIRTGRSGNLPASPAVANGDYGPAQLRSAYKLTAASAKKGKGVTIAIVDAFNDPHLAADLGHYRSHFHLSACTTKSGCLKVVNQSGNSGPLPRADAGWATEESLDVDMVSAICSKCHILLVEAKSAFTNDLGAAEQTAIKKGARFVSNSWSGGESFGQDIFNPDFNHPGDVIAFAAGDFGTGPAYPTDLQYVTAVGGTTLKHAKGKRGWSETAWGANKASAFGTGSGCSVLEPKASWQRADANASTGCLNRTENDVSAVGDPDTGVLIYDTYKSQPSGLADIGGTSAATPIITSIYALAGTPAHGTYPAEYPYLHTSHLFDVTSGVNGKCESFRQYICHGKKGYDGPTGLGTPNGTGAFTDTAHRVTLVDPGTQDVALSSAFSQAITGLDSKHASSLAWSATGLPSGLHISAISGSTNGRITGVVPAAPGTFHVTVTAKDGSVTATTHFNIVVIASMAAANPPTGPVVLTSAGLCLDGGTDASGQAVHVQSCPNGQDFAITSDGGPDDVQTVSIGGNCLTVADTAAPQQVSLSACDGEAEQQWEYLGFGALWSPVTGNCLAAPSQAAGDQVVTANCTFGPSQSWALPAGPIITGAGGLCLSNPSGSAVQVATCDGSTSQSFTLLPDGTIASSSGKCLAANGSFVQTAVTLQNCDDQNAFQVWETGSFGEINNFAFGMCLADKNGGGAGSTVVQYDCYGDPGQNWGLN